jgi:hypothetical protein
MSLNFPASPTPGQRFTSEGVTFIWTGTVWVVPPSGLILATEAEARAGAVNDRAMTPLRGAQAIASIDSPPPPVVPPAAVCVALCFFNGQTGQIWWERNIASLAGANSGNYTLTFRNPTVDTNYIVLGAACGITNHPLVEVSPDANTFTTGSFEIQVGTTGGNLTSQLGFLVASPIIQVGVFR